MCATFGLLFGEACALYIHAEENTCSHFNHTCNIVLLYERVPCRKREPYMDTSFFGGHQKCQVKIYVPKYEPSCVYLLRHTHSHTHSFSHSRELYRLYYYFIVTYYYTYRRVYYYLRLYTVIRAGSDKTV